MIDFKPLRIEDRPTIERYTLLATHQNCDLSFANMFCWQPVFESAWAEVEGYLIIRFRINGGNELGYMQPIGGDGSFDFSHLIPRMAQDAHANGQRLRVIGLTEMGRITLNNSHHNNFAFHSDRNYEDYIYNRTDLDSLTGKKYQPKRNHINQFEAKYNYEYRELTPDLFDDCLRLDNEWRESQTDTSERVAIEQAFRHFSELGLFGGAIIIDNKVAAFTYGSAINSHTFCTHIEKGDRNYIGIYSALNKLFAQSLPPQYTHINREEDMGIEGLRRAKLSYNPAYLQPKYTAIYMHHHEAECKKLWQRVFGDDDQFVDHFLIKYFSDKGLISFVDVDNRYIAMLHIIPMTTPEGLQVAYIYGVATHPNFRNLGYASKLMSAAIKKVTTDGYDLAMLIPSEESLFDFYARFGFQRGDCITFTTPDSFDFGGDDPARNIAMYLPITCPITQEIKELIFNQADTH